MFMKGNNLFKETSKPHYSHSHPL